MPVAFIAGRSQDNTSTGAFSNGDPNIFTPGGDNAVVNIGEIINRLNTGTNVTISTSGTGTQEGNITTPNGLSIVTTRNTKPVNLTLQASNDITLQNFGITANNAPLNVMLQAGVGSTRGNVSLTNGSVETNGGAFTATAPGSVSLERVAITSSNNSEIPASPITINANSVSINTPGNPSIRSNTSGNGDGALISINANSLALQQGSSITTNTRGNGNGGSVVIKADSLILPQGGSINSDTTGNGNSGSLNINVNSLSANNGTISSRTEGSGNAGNVTINAKSNVQFSQNGGLQSTTTGNGNAGAVAVTATSVSLQDHAGINTTAYGNITSQGNAGNITINATDGIYIQNGGFLNAGTLGQGNAGSINIKTGSLKFENSGLGNDTGIDRNNNNRLINNTGHAGNWNIMADAVSLESSSITSETGGSGNAGNFRLTATNSLVLRNNSNISTGSQPNTSGNAGNIDITARSFVIENDTSNQRAGLGSDTRGRGNAGQINIHADSVVLRNRGGIGITSTGVGKAGQLNLIANSLELIESGIGSDRTTTGNAGEININVVGTLSLNKSGINTSNTSSREAAGRINLKAGSIILNNRSNIYSDTDGSGNGGNLNLQIDRALIVGDRSRISVSSTPTSSGSSTQLGEAGNIYVQAGSIFLFNQGMIVGQSTSGNGGSITLAPRNLLLLRQKSQISTTSGTRQTGSGNGGNIRINTPSGVIAGVLTENSDITANAFEGRGGVINITAAGVFGLQLSNQLTPFSDITAISQQNPQLNGVVQLDISNVDPSSGLVLLPTSLVDASSKLRDVSCGALNNHEGEVNEFIVTGSGGLPPSPNEPLSSDVVWSDTRMPTWLRGIALQQRAEKPTAKLPSKPTSVKIVPATGWVFNNQGEVTLISSQTHPTGLATTPLCHQ